jgi:hypothetical protein
MTASEFHEKFPHQDEINSNVLTDVACPNCGSRGRFSIECSTTVLCGDDGTEDDGDHLWEDTSSCSCRSCGHGATVADFTIEGLDDFLSELE